MSFTDKLKLNAGDTLRRDGSRSKGFMDETDITYYTILDEVGNAIGSVEYTETIAVKGFRVTNSVTQKDSQGKVVVNIAW